MKKILKKLLVTTSSLGIISGAATGIVIDTQRSNSTLGTTDASNTIDVNAVNTVISSLQSTFHGTNSLKAQNLITIVNNVGALPQLPQGVNLIFAITNGYSPHKGDWRENVPQTGFVNGYSLWITAKLWNNYSKSDDKIDFQMKQFRVLGLQPEQKFVDPSVFNASNWKYTIGPNNKVLPPQDFVFPHVQVLYLVQHPSAIDYGVAYNNPAKYQIFSPTSFDTLNNDDILWVFATTQYGYSWQANGTVLPKMVTIHGVS